jgi:hypothetical protein
VGVLTGERAGVIFRQDSTVGNEPGPVRRYEVRLSATRAQWAWAVAIAGVAWLLIHRFAYGERQVDIPACTADCSAYGLEFQDYRSSKSGSFCDCRGGTFPLTLRTSYNVTGGRGFVHDLVNGLVRFTATVGGTLLWAAGLFAAAFALWPRLRGMLKR